MQTEEHFTISIFIALLLVASGVAMASKWIRVPYTLLLVLVGLAISPMHFLPVVHISPDLILLIFLPALLFEAAWNLKFAELRENLVPILTLAVVGVCLSVGVVGGLLHLAVGMRLDQALLFGAMISATDPVSVLALFKKLGLPHRLATVVEGESLINDGAAVVVFKIILGIVVGTGAHSTGGLLLGSVSEFLVVVFGGLMVGAVIGIIATTLTSYFDDHLLEITLTTIAAYGSFLLAESLHVSPVIAILAVGLIIGNYARDRGMSATTEVAVHSFWEYAAFVVNSLVFLLIGLEIQYITLRESLVMILWGILAMLVGRLFSVYALVPIANRFSNPVPLKWQHVLFWGGLRGSLSLALVLSLPIALEGRSQLVAMVFGAVLFSLLVQGFSITPLISLLGLSQAEPRLQEYEILQSRLLAETAALAELEDLRKQGRITERVYQGLRESVSKNLDELRERLEQFDLLDHALEQQLTRRFRQHLVDVRKTRLSELLHAGLLSEAGYRSIKHRLDEEIVEREVAEDAAHEASRAS